MPDPTTPQAIEVQPSPAAVQPAPSAEQQQAAVVPPQPPAEPVEGPAGPQPADAQPTPDPATGETAQAEQPPSVLGHVVNALTDAKNFLTSPAEIARSVLKGGISAVNETAHTINDALPDATPVPKYDPATGKFSLVAEPKKPATELPVPEPHTGTGEFVSSAVQFTSGMAGIGKIAKAGEGASMLVKGADTILRSGASMAAFFDPYTARLSNLMQSYPSLQNPVSAFLAADPNDSAAVSRLKAGLEGAGIGAMLEPLGWGVRAISHYLKGDAPAAVAAATRASNSSQGAADETLAAATPKPTLEDIAAGNPKPTEAAPAAQPSETPTTAPVPEVTNTPKPEEVASADSNPQPEGPEEPQRITREEAQQVANALVGNRQARMAARDPSQLPDTAPPVRAPINTNYLDQPEHVKAILSEVGSLIEPTLNKSDMTFDGLTDASRSMALAGARDPADLAQQLLEASGSVQDAAKTATAGSAVVNGLNSEINRLVGLAAEGRLGEFATDEDLRAALGLTLQAQFNVGSARGELGSSLGGGLNSLKNIPDGTAAMQEALKEFAVNGANDDAVKLFIERLRFGRGDLETNAAITKPLIQQLYNKGTQAMSSYYVNALLGFKTLIVKGSSDILKGGLIQPMEQAARGVYRGMAGGGWEQLTQAGSQLHGLQMALFDTLKFGGRSVWANSISAFKTGKQVLDASAFTDGGSHANPFEMSGGVIANIESGNYVHAMVNSVGNTVGLPGRLINSLHELSQQIIYRSRVYGKAMTDTRLLNYDDAQTGAYVTQKMQDAFAQPGEKLPGGRIALGGEAKDAEALGYAQDGTYSRPLDATSPSLLENAAAKVQGLQQDHPGLRVVLPFLKAPTRLMQDVFRYTPMLQGAKDLFKGEFAAGGQRAEQAVGKLAVGSTLWGGATMLAMNGLITDSGPSDPNALKQKEDTGWRAHSLVLHDGDGTPHYYPLDRIDPLGGILAMAADGASIAPHLNPQEWQSAANQMTLAISKDALSKTYLRNAGDFLSTFTSLRSEDDADKKFETLYRNMAGGLVPAMLANTNPDPYMREVRSVLDGLKNRIDGLSQTLDPQRNVLGEPVERTPSLGPQWLSPFYHSMGDSTDKVSQELANVADQNPQGFKPPPKKMRENDAGATPGVDLTQIPSANGHSAYDRYQELTERLSPNAPSLRDKLNDFISGSKWQSLATGNHDYEGARFKEVNAIISGARQQAKKALMDENPAVAAALKQDSKNSANVMTGKGTPQPAPGITLKQ